MKLMKNYLSLLVALLLMGATCVMYTSCDDDDAGPVDRSGVDENGREYVDLGLPTGTLWAAWNVGADSPEEYGDYFAWGETVAKTYYYWSTYAWAVPGGGYYQMTKYCSDASCGYNGYTDETKLTELLPEDDAATANWGPKWQTPSIAQLEELVNPDYTTMEWTTRNGVNGMLVTSKTNNNSIFLPAAGENYVDISDNPIIYEKGESTYYWARTLRESGGMFASYLYIYDNDAYTDGGIYRCTGLPVRAVRK